MGNMNKEIHDIQASVLRRLLLSETMRFSDLQPDGISSDQFTFHLKKLAEVGIIQKNEDGTYRLTASGKEYANRFDIDSGSAKTEKQAKLSVLVMAVNEENGVKKYVMQQRLKQPYFGFRGFVTGKIKMGESVLETAARELKEETGLSGELEQKAIYHERIYSSAGELLEDKYFFVCVATDVKGDLVQDFEGGRNEWVFEKDIMSGSNFYDIGDLLALVKHDGPLFSEKSYTVEKY